MYGTRCELWAGGLGGDNPQSDFVPFSDGKVQPTMSRPWAKNIYDDLSLLSALGPPFSGFRVKRCQGFVRCDMDIDAEVVGWVIGRKGATIKDLKYKTGCNMWVDQQALRLTITGPDACTVEHAAKSVQAYVAAAPIKAGAVEAAVACFLICPAQLLDFLGSRDTIAGIVKETRAHLVVNKKMARVIVRGVPSAVQLACAKVQTMITSAAAEHQYNTELDAERIGLALQRAAEKERGGSDRDSTSSCMTREHGINAAVDGPTSLHSLCVRTQSVFSNKSSPLIEPRSSSSSSSHATVSRASSPVSSRQASGSAAVAEGTTLVSAPTSIEGLLAQLKLSKYQSAFEENEVDLEALPLMSEADFSELGILKGSRLKIIHAVKGMPGMFTSDGSTDNASTVDRTNKASL